MCVCMSLSLSLSLTHTHTHTHTVGPLGGYSSFHDAIRKSRGRPKVVAAKHINKAKVLSLSLPV